MERNVEKMLNRVSVVFLSIGTVLMNARIWFSGAWKSRLSSFSTYFLRFRDLGFIQNHTKALCLSDGAGHAPMALSQIGLSDVTAVELVDSISLVKRADPHNLPFFDRVFDFVFTAHLAEALFPWRFVEEMERTVRHGGFCMVAVDECSGDNVRDIARFFHNSKVVDVANVTLERAYTIQSSRLSFMKVF
ncbi:putative methyltransferase type 11, S-adenosyl-L-methionine-dependent methyltransferase [Arabidopsis thaliana]